jgi:hypothetical protein
VCVFLIVNSMNFQVIDVKDIDTIKVVGLCSVIIDVVKSFDLF